MASDRKSPLYTAELGVLRSTPNEESRFIGSSSGIFFVNTVRKAFSAVSAAPEVEKEPLPLAEECVVGSDSETPDSLHINDAGGAWTSSPQLYDDAALSNAIGLPPSRDIATELVMLYFRTWHPIFPFLHGPTFLQDLESLYATEPPAYSIKNASQATMLQCVFNIASLDRPGLELPAKSKLKSPGNILYLTGLLVQKHELSCIQALLAAQIYLLATMSLRAASTVGGLIFRSILHSGLHRCPFRYEQISPHECDVRKRVFWSAYAIDRYLSQALGLPLGIQDSDFDVCLPGIQDLHHPVIHNGRITGDAADELRLHLPQEPRRSRVESNEGSSPGQHEMAIGDPETEAKQRREAALANYVKYSKLTGRALEVFHKSIHARHAERDAILFLSSDVDGWWNDLPSFLQDFPSADQTPEEGAFNLSFFFTTLYQQLIFLINRPSLSLDVSKPEFRSGLQTCIRAGRTIISTLKTQLSKGHAMFWPGLLSGAWMSGLIIAFACHLGFYSPSKGESEISSCLDVLNSMDKRWTTAKHCHTVLASLLADLRHNSNRRAQRSREETEKPQSSSKPHARTSSFGREDSSTKKRRLNGNSDDMGDPNDTRQVEWSAHRSSHVNAHQSGDFSLPQQAFSSVRSDSMHNARDFSDDIAPPNAQDAFRSAPVNNELYNGPSAHGSPQVAFDKQTQVGPDFLSNESWVNTMSLSSMADYGVGELDDPISADTDLNRADIFEGATWENLIEFMGQEGLY